jgi:hypothetical protein
MTANTHGTVRKVYFLQQITEISFHKRCVMFMTRKTKPVSFSKSFIRNQMKKRYVSVLLNWHKHRCSAVPILRYMAENSVCTTHHSETSERDVYHQNSLPVNWATSICAWKVENYDQVSDVTIFVVGLDRSMGGSQGGMRPFAGSSIQVDILQKFIFCIHCNILKLAY